MKGSSSFLIVISVLMVAMIAWALAYPDIETAILPLIFCTAVLVLAVVQLVIEIRGAKSLPAEITEGQTDSLSDKESYLVISGWLVGMLVGVYVFGLLLATTIFVFLYIKLHGRSWINAIGLAVMFFVLSYGLFVMVLRIRLYSGLLFISY